MFKSKGLLLLAASVAVLAVTFIAIGTTFDHTTRVFLVLLNAVPHWWLGLMVLVALRSEHPIERGAQIGTTPAR